MHAHMTESCVLDARLRADPLADGTVARILGTEDLPRWEAIALLDGAMASWDSNGALDGWQAGAGMPAPIAAALEEYVRQARALPEWVDAGNIGCAEAVFADLGVLSVTLTACAGLPEAGVTADPLGQSLDEQLRRAAALMLAALLPGGLLDPNGAGVAQALTVRLQHALTRHLLVRGNPGEALAYGAAIPALLPEGGDVHRTLFARGWDVRANGLPRNQEEMAGTLLSWHFVVLRSLRRLGLGLSRQEERAWLHAWNVVGHLLGVEEALLAATMREAAALFAQLQGNARALAGARYAQAGKQGAFAARMRDPRPALGESLARTLRLEIGRPALQAFPVLLARRLCEPASARILGLDDRASRLARASFALGMGAARIVDSGARLLCPGLSLRRLGARILGQRLALRYLADPARPLPLPEPLLRQVDGLLRAWERDPAAPRWVNAIERRCGARRLSPATQASAAC